MVAGRAPGDERGTALLCALLIIALLTTLGAALVVMVTTETLVSAHHAASQQALYAAEAGAERAIGELRVLPTWQTVPMPGSPSASADLDDGSLAPELPDGTVLDLPQLTAERQTESDASFPTTPDRPAWRLFGHVSLDRMIAESTGSAPPYVVVWVADDPADLDGDPARDSNDIVMVRADAFGVAGVRRSIHATVLRQSALDPAAGTGVMRSDVNVIAWLETR
jgi:Tfp pilus assembly protein PilX